jgi:hypothetical protein
MEQHMFQNMGQDKNQKPLSCDSINYTFDGINIAKSNCWSIGALFEEWFTYNNYRGIPTDVYFETSFTKTGIKKFSDKLKVVEDRRKGEKIYQQEPYDDSIDEINTGWLPTLEVFFYECLKPNKTKCHHNPSVHIHYVDLRVGFYDNIELLEHYTTMYTPDLLYFTIDGDFVNYLKLLTQYKLNVRDIEKYVEKINKDILDFNKVFFSLIANADQIILDFYFGELPLTRAINKYRNYILKITTQTDVQRLYLNKLTSIEATAVIRNDNPLMTRTAAEYKRLQKFDPTLADKLKQFVINAVKIHKNDYIENYKRSVAQIVTDPENINKIEYDMLDIVERLAREMVPFSAFNMDIYTISRMFAQYSLRSDELPENENYQVILYAGLAHNARYISFLLQYLHANLLFEHTAYTDERCIFMYYQHLEPLEGLFDPYLYRHHYLSFR